MHMCFSLLLRKTFSWILEWRDISIVFLWKLVLLKLRNKAKHLLLTIINEMAHRVERYIFCFLPSGGTKNISSHSLTGKTKLIKMYLQNVPFKKLGSNNTYFKSCMNFQLFNSLILLKDLNVLPKPNTHTHVCVCASKILSCYIFRSKSHTIR